MEYVHINFFLNDIDFDITANECKRLQTYENSTQISRVQACQKHTQLC